MAFETVCLGAHSQNGKRTGWSTLQNGELLRQVERAGFEVFITPDKNLIYQQNPIDRNIAIVILGQNRWTLIRRQLNAVAKAVNEAKPGEAKVVEISY